MSTTDTIAATVRPLTAAEADQLVATARREADAAGIAVSISVLDAGGNLLAFRRDKKAVLISGETSTRKAFASVQLASPTADLVDLVQPGALFHTLATALDRPLLFIEGGVPLHRDGQLIGAIGVGGGAPHQDGAVALTAAAALVG